VLFHLSCWPAAVNRTANAIRTFGFFRMDILRSGGPHLGGGDHLVFIEPA
jgi:hypothetical protein